MSRGGEPEGKCNRAGTFGLKRTFRTTRHVIDLSSLNSEREGPSAYGSRRFLRVAVTRRWTTRGTAGYRVIVLRAERFHVATVKNE